MGDPTTVTLTFLKSQKDDIREFLRFDVDDEWDDDLFSSYQFYEVNYGNLNFLDALVEAGIAFDSHWEAGDEYGPGCESCRFTADGDVIRKSISDDYRNPDIGTLMEKINDYAALKQFITDHYDEISVLSWENQENYGKLYRTKQLITT